VAYDLVLTANYSPWSRYSGGGQKSVHMIATEMAKQGLKVAVVFSKVPWETVKVPEGLLYDVHWALFLALKPGISSPLRFLNGIPFLFKVRALSGPGTVLHGNGDESSLLWLIGRLLGRKKKFVYTNRYPEFPTFLHGADWRRLSTWIRIFFREPRFPALALAVRRCDALTVTSTSSLHQVMESFGPEAERGQVVPNGVDPLALELPMESSSRSGVLFFGRLTKAKGPDLVLEAYALLPEALRKDHPLRILGNGPLKADLEKRAQALGVSADFHGWKSGADLAREILAAKVVCLPSREESFGNTVAETLALGQALVTSTAGSIPEVAGPFGRQVEGESPAALADALRADLEAPATVGGRAEQREYVRNRFSWAKTAERFREIYNG
jgi:glycosyltransferase involved in cell wall biosynthesis